MSYGDFLRGLLKDPRGVSAPTPSSPALAATMAERVDPLRPGLVVELGAGTGVVTEALLARGISPERLVVIEHSAYFADLLRSRFPDATVIQGDAFAFERYLPPDAKVSAVVSGVPLLNFPLWRRKTLIERALAVQDGGGRFVQLSYGWKPPIAPGRRELSKTIVWRNFPPAHIWTYRALPQEVLATREAPRAEPLSSALS
jgi:phosphatidylethanolamine/phosphatidyl-N-methylethanolamine N-methyltransferase